jgi:hypothetical protein
MNFPKNAEYWRSIDNFPKYEVSTDGRVRIAKTGKMMKLSTDHKGYIYVGLYKDRKQSCFKVHRLVAFAFCDRDESNVQVDHIDRNKANNCYQNLRWTTNSGNGRNKTKQKNNTSGYTGVTFRKRDRVWVASWNEIETKTKSKTFCIQQYGEEVAKQMAIDYRKQMAEANGYLNV